MNERTDRFEEQYLKGELTLNKKSVAVFMVVILALLVAGFISAKERSKKHEAALNAKLTMLADKHGEEITRFTKELRNAGMSRKDGNCAYGHCEKVYECLDYEPAKNLDNLLREKFSFSAVGFTARVIFPHESGGFFFFGPGVKEYNEVPYDMYYFNPCINELLKKGICVLDDEQSRTEDVYSFKTIIDLETKEIKAVLLGRKAI